MEKIKNIIEQLKKSIPFLNKGKNGEVDIEEEATAPNHDLNELNKKLSSGSEEEVEVDSENEKPELSDADKERKKKIMIVVVLAMAFFLFGPEDEEAENKNTAKVEKNKKPRSGKNVLKTKKPVDTKISDSATGTGSDINNKTKNEFIIPEEEMSNDDQDAPVIKSPEKLLDLTNYGDTVSFGEEDNQLGSGEAEAIENPFESLPTVQDLNLDQDVDISEGENEYKAFDQISDKLNEDLNKKKMIKVNYESLGRGLAYNCEMGYWVCLNKQEYTNCRENLKWANKLGNKRECVPQDVYAGIKDCQIMQVHFINTNTSVSFCH